MTERQTMTTPAVCRRTGLTYRQIDYWCRIGVITPSVAASGSGSQRRFTRAEVRAIRLLAVLAAIHVPIGNLAPLYRATCATGPEFWDGVVCVTADGQMWDVQDFPGDVIAGWVVNLGRILEAELEADRELMAAS